MNRRFKKISNFFYQRLLNPSRWFRGRDLNPHKTAYEAGQ